MPPTIGGIGIDPQGQTVTVSITPAAKVYVDQAGATLASFPQTISGRMSYFVASAGPYAVSVLFNGAEIANPNGQAVTVQIDQGQMEWIAPTIDRPAEDTTQSGTYARGTSAGLANLAALPTPSASNKGVVYRTADGAIYESTGLAYITHREPAGTNAPKEAAAVQVDVYSSAGSSTWTKPTWAKSIDVYVIAAGCGGGSGRKGAAGTVRCGGGSGAGGALSIVTDLVASDLPATVNVTVGAGGVGGATVTTNDTDGNAGTAGGASYFGPTGATAYVGAQPGAAGAGGTATSGTGGVNSAALGSVSGNAGINASATGGAGLPGGAGTGGATSGGSGGGITSGNVAGAGGLGVSHRAKAGVTPPAAGQSATVALANAPIPGSGPGGGDASTTGDAMAGGNGVKGSGGAGGGAAVNSVGNSGKGGDGGDGFMLIVSRGGGASNAPSPDDPPLFFADVVGTWWTNPRAAWVGLGGGHEQLLVAGTGADGAATVNSYPTATKLVTRAVLDTFLEKVTTTPPYYYGDDHNNPAMVAIDGKKAVLAYTRHTKDALLRIKRSTANADAESPLVNFDPVATTITFSESISYAQLQWFNNEIHAWSCPGAHCWAHVRSTDWAATWPDPPVVVFEGKEASTVGGLNMYAPMINVGGADQTCRVAMATHVSQDTLSGQVHYAEVGLVSGNVSTPNLGVLGNLYSGANLPLKRSQLDRVWLPSGDWRTWIYDVSAGANPEIVWASFMPADVAGTSVYKYATRVGGVWQVHDITGASAGTGFNVDPARPTVQLYLGGAKFLAPGVVLLSRLANGIWTIEKKTTTDNGVTWTTKVLAASADILARPWPVLNANGTIDFIYQTFTRYPGEVGAGGYHNFDGYTVANHT